MSVNILFASIYDEWFIENYNSLILLLNCKDKTRFDHMKSLLKQQQLLLSRVLMLQAAEQLIKKANSNNSPKFFINNLSIEKYKIENFNKLTINLNGQTIAFSISITHSGSIAAICLSREIVKIGIDIEQIRSRNFVELSYEICSPQELDKLKGNEIKPEEFYKLWTAKEALSKASGIHLSDLFASNCSDILTDKKGVFQLAKSTYWFDTVMLNSKTTYFIATIVINVKAFSAYSKNKSSYEVLSDISWQRYNHKLIS